MLNVYMWNATHLSDGCFCVTNFPLIEQVIELSITYQSTLWLWTRVYFHTEAKRILGGDYA